MNIKSAPRLGRSLTALSASFVLALVHQYLFYGSTSGCIIPHLCHSLLRIYVSLDAGSHAGFHAVWVAAVSRL